LLAPGLKLSSDQDLPVGLHSQGVDVVVRPGIECEVHRAVCVEPRDSAARRRQAGSASDGGEVSADQDLSVRLHRNGLDDRVRARIEARIDGAVHVEPPDAIARRRAGSAAKAGESAADDDLAIRLHREGVDHLVRARIERVHRLRARDDGAAQNGDRADDDRGRAQHDTSGHIQISYGTRRIRAFAELSRFARTRDEYRLTSNAAKGG
jgi:hypothetical protein